MCPGSLRSFYLTVVTVLALALLVSLIASAANVAYERFVASPPREQAPMMDAYVSARAALLPPPKVLSGGGMTPSQSYLDDPLPGNAHATRSRVAWTYAIRDPPHREETRVYVADDAAAVLRSPLSTGGGAWEAVPVSSDADAYPATISAIRTIIADAFDVREGRPQLVRAVIEGLWRPIPSAASTSTRPSAPPIRAELWRVLACFAGDNNDPGRCFRMDVLLHQPTQFRGPPGRLLFATSVGVIDGGVLSQPHTDAS